MRHLTIGLFGIIMAIAILLQIHDPLMPWYSVGLLIGICTLHTFVIEGERTEYRKALEASVDRELMKEEELGSTKKIAYTDPLTGVKNKFSYLEYESKFDKRIVESEEINFGIAVFDVNELKWVNDHLGHSAGDTYICDACKIICNTFKHSPVFRIGGDEFAVILEGQDLENIEILLNQFNGLMDENVKKKEVIVACGYSKYDNTIDNIFGDVFQRADRDMYKRKKILKGIAAEMLKN